VARLRQSPVREGSVQTDVAQAAMPTAAMPIGALRFDHEQVHWHSFRMDCSWNTVTGNGAEYGNRRQLHRTFSERGVTGKKGEGCTPLSWLDPGWTIAGTVQEATVAHLLGKEKRGRRQLSRTKGDGGG